MAVASRNRCSPDCGVERLVLDVKQPAAVQRADRDRRGIATVNQPLQKVLQLVGRGGVDRRRDLFPCGVQYGQRLQVRQFTVGWNWSTAIHCQ